MLLYNNVAELRQKLDGGHHGLAETADLIAGRRNEGAPYP
jgi:hypothetical protein